MCVAFWSLEHPDYALILCSNRDEFLSRPTKEAHFHSFDHAVEEGSVLSGIDVRAGGTWLGISRSGRIAVLTNITEPPQKFSTSRGHLVSSFLASNSADPFEAELGRLIPAEAKFAGFNLLLLAPSSRDTSTLSLDGVFVTNHGGGGQIIAEPLNGDRRRCGGMSNGIENQGAQEWPKVQRGIQSLQTALETLSSDISEDDLVERLFELLTWSSPEVPRERSELRNTIQVTPLPIVLNSSSAAASCDFYGTRLSTVILITRDGHVTFVERDVWKIDDAGRATKADLSRREFKFQLSHQTSNVNQ